MLTVSVRIFWNFLSNTSQYKTNAAIDIENNIQFNNSVVLAIGVTIAIQIMILKIPRFKCFKNKFWQNNERF